MYVCLRGGLSGERGELTVINEEEFPIGSCSHHPVGLEVKIHRETVSTFLHTHLGSPSCASCHNTGISLECAQYMHVQNSVLGLDISP